VPVAVVPPHDRQVILDTRPVGSPPLYTVGGLTWPNPVPWTKSPAGWPSEGGAAGTVEVDGTAEAAGVLGAAAGLLAAGLLAAACVGVAEEVAAACGVDWQPATAARAATAASAARAVRNFGVLFMVVSVSPLARSGASPALLVLGVPARLARTASPRVSRRHP
jgi:hypothetical protein